MAGNERGVKYDHRGSEELRTTAYLMALKANRDNMINGDTIPTVIYKEKSMLKRKKEEEREGVSHIRSLTRTYSIHKLTNDMRNAEEETESMGYNEQVNPADEFEQSIFNSASKISFDSKTIVIKDRRGKAFEPIYDDNGKMTGMRFYAEKPKDIMPSNVLQKIKAVEKVSKELIDKSVEKGMSLNDYCAAMNALHEIGNSGAYNAENVKMSAGYARTELEKLEILPVRGTQAYIVNIGIALRELSEI